MVAQVTSLNTPRAQKNPTLSEVEPPARPALNVGNMEAQPADAEASRCRYELMHCYLTDPDMDVVYIPSSN